MNSVQDKIEDTVDAVASQPVREGRWTKAIENQTAKIPSVFFLNLALGSIVLSAVLKLINKDEDTTGSFVGLWAPTFLLLGLYNKLVKIEGNDRYDRA